MRALITVVALALACAPALGGGDDPAKLARARALYEEGMKHYDLGRFSEAMEEFQQGYMNKPDPAFLFNVAQCRRQLGQWKEAAYAYRRYLGQAPEATNRKEVEGFIASAEEEIRRKEASVQPMGVIAPREAHPPAAAPVEQPPVAKPAVEQPAAPRVEEKRAVEKPAVAPVVEQPVAEPPDATAAPTPIYKKWWLWTAVGVAAVVGVGVGVGVGYALPNDAAFPASDAIQTSISF